MMKIILVQQVVIDINDHQDIMMIDIIIIDIQKGTKQRFSEKIISDSFSYRSTEKEIPLPEEETVQFNPEDVVLDFCKYKKYISIIECAMLVFPFVIS